jgi:large repetitive protein
LQRIRSRRRSRGRRPAPIGYGTPLGPAQFNASANVPGTLVYSPPAGTILGVGDDQPLSVSFTPADTATYATASANVAITVTKGTPAINWATPANIVYGTPLGASHSTATTTIAGTFAYTPSAGVMLSAGNAQTLAVTFTPDDTANYNVTSAFVAINVVKATPVISWPAPSPVSFGTVLTETQLNATSSVRGTLVYTPSAGAVLSPGAHTLSVTFTPDDTVNYTGTSATASLTVLKGLPDLSWATPADIVYGTPLGAAQLNATSSVPGTFAYSPAPGTVLPVGVGQTLSVTFTPSDTASYNSATASVSLNVLKATPTINWPVPAPIAFGTPRGAAPVISGVALTTSIETIADAWS